MQEKKDSAPDSAFQIALLEGIYRRDADDPRTVELLATLYTEAGMYGKGLELDLRHMELEPRNPTARYNCACSCSLLGRLDEAFERLREALEMGFDGLEWMQEDPDLVSVRADPRWQELLGM